MGSLTFNFLILNTDEIIATERNQTFFAARNTGVQTLVLPLVET